MKTFTLFAIAALVLTVAAVGAEKPSHIKARGSPTGAGLFVDGKYIGPAGRFTVPEKFQVAPGEHEITLRDPRCEEYSTKGKRPAGQDDQDQLQAQEAPYAHGTLRGVVSRTVTLEANKVIVIPLTR